MGLLSLVLSGRSWGWVLLASMGWMGVGCSPSALVAHALRVAPNRVPEFAKPSAPVVLRWPGGLLERFPSGTNVVGDPAVPLHWRIIEPADYGLTLSLSNRVSSGRTNHEFSFHFKLPKEGLPPAHSALGTVFLIHGYGVDGDALFPWGLYLAEAGWRTVLMDLRGHGSSGGRRVGFGVLETNDLRCLKESLEASGRVAGPYVALGHSLGASLAIRWQAVDPSIQASVALGAYAGFESAVVRLRDGYAPWVPRAWARGAARRLPGMLGVGPEGLDTEAAMRGKSLRVFLVAGWGDGVTPPEDSGELKKLAGQGSGFLIIAPASHEMLPYLFPDHGKPVVEWLAAGPWHPPGGSRVASQEEPVTSRAEPAH